MGILWGYPQDILWVWDGYGDRNSVPTAALLSACLSVCWWAVQKLMSRSGCKKPRIRRGPVLPNGKGHFGGTCTQDPLASGRAQSSCPPRSTNSTPRGSQAAAIRAAATITVAICFDFVWVESNRDNLIHVHLCVWIYIVRRCRYISYIHHGFLTWVHAPPGDNKRSISGGGCTGGRTNPRTPRAGFSSAQYSAEQDPRKFRAGMLSLDFEEGSGLGLDHVVSGFGVVLVPRGSTVFTCIGALGTPSRTGPLARKYLPGFPYSWSLRRLRQKISGIYCTVICKLTRYALLVFVRSCSSINNKIISFKKFISPQPVGGPQKEKKSGAPGHVPSVPIG